MIFYGLSVSIALNVVVMILLLLLFVRQRRVVKNIKMIGEKAAEGNLPHIINQSYESINKLNDEIEQLNNYYSKLFRLTNNNLQNVGLVRYNAFQEMGGSLSFTLALLNNQKDGLILTSINGRNDHRLFVKQLSAGISKDQPLTDEETQAIAEALKSSRKIIRSKKKKEAALTEDQKKIGS